MLDVGVEITGIVVLVSVKFVMVGVVSAVQEGELEMPVIGNRLRVVFGMTPLIKLAGTSVLVHPAGLKDIHWKS